MGAVPDSRLYFREPAAPRGFANVTFSVGLLKEQMLGYLRIGAVVFFASFVSCPEAKTPEQVFQEASRSVVVIHVDDQDGNPVNQGGGVVTGKESVATNCHVVTDGARISVHYDKRVLEATLKHSDLERDLCQIEVPRLNAPQAPLWTGRLRVGQRVYAIGAPEGLELTISEGLISSLREFDDEQYIQTSAAISQGSSGGGLFDSEGRLIGITSFFLAEGQNLNFALPAKWIEALGSRTGSVARPVGEKDQMAMKWVARIAGLKAKKDWAGALSVAQQWVRSQPMQAIAWQELGDAYRNINRPRRAVSPYMQALRIDPDLFGSWLNLGFSYLSLNQYERAIESFVEALRLRPGDATALYNTGVAYYFQNRQDKVKEVYAALVKLDPKVAQEFSKKYITR